MNGWTDAVLKPLAGQRALVTGASGGIGYQTALALAGAGVQVILAARNAQKNQRARDAILAVHPSAQLTLLPLDLASLASVRQAAEALRGQAQPLDMLINNAGVMALPQRQLSVDGFELQLATNFLGHFSLSAQLLPLLRQSAMPRLVQLSSIAHKQGRIDLDDLQGAHHYRPWKAYSQSKLAMLMFALELQRRSDAAGWGLISQAAHPGFARTELIANGPAAQGRGSLFWALTQRLTRGFSQSAAAGTQPVLMALLAEPGGQYFGPQGLADMKGPPGIARIARQGRDAAMAARLWQAAEALTGAHWG